MNFENHQKKERDPEFYELINGEEINNTIKEIEENFNFDLKNISISVANPGDKLFCKHEILHKLAQKNDLEVIISKYFPNIKNLEDLNIENLRDVAEKEKVSLNGELPGFVLTHGEDEIIFFNIKNEKILEMANNYAKKERAGLSFKEKEDAFKYLKNLSRNALLHEIGHIIYSRNIDLLEDWNKYLNSNCENSLKIKDRVKEIQSDKYLNIEDIPIEEEAFAEFLVYTLSREKINSRLGKNDEAIEIINKCLINLKK